MIASFIANLIIIPVCIVVQADDEDTFICYLGNSFYRSIARLSPVTRGV